MVGFALLFAVLLDVALPVAAEFGAGAASAFSILSWMYWKSGRAGLMFASVKGRLRTRPALTRISSVTQASAFSSLMLVLMSCWRARARSGKERASCSGLACCVMAPMTQRCRAIRS